MSTPTARRTATAAVLAAVGALVGATAFLMGGPREAASQATPGKGERGMPLEVFIRRFDALGPGIQVQVGQPKPGPVEGLETVPVAITAGGRTQRLEIYRTPDGRHLLLGSLLDLTKDPFAAAAARIDVAGRPTLGRADAPVTIVEYSDFQCPYCRQMSPVVQQTMKGPLGKDVRWVYKHFPLTSVHPWAEPAAVAAECARQIGGNGRFWALHDHYFAEQDAFTPQNHRERVLVWARGAGVPAHRFERCLDDPATLERVRADTNEGRALGVEQTPTLVINGRVTPGSRSAADLAALIEQELAYQRELARLQGGS